MTENPLTRNRYDYTTNNPLNYSDPTGHSLWSRIKDAAKKAAKNIGSIEIEGRSMDMQMHEIYSEQIAQQLIQKAYIPLQGEVTFEDVKNGYERYFKNPNKGTIVEYEDYVYISSWTRKKELFDNALHTVYNELKSWPEERYFERDGGFKNWMLELEKKASNHEVLEANYRMKFEKYKIEKLPERPFCF